jgi:hypothetical protein
MAKFVIADYFGDTVECSESQWNEHVIRGHPEMSGHEAEVIAAIQTPLSIFEGNVRNSKAFQGITIPTGFWTGATPIAVVRYQQAFGFLITAYLGSPGRDWRLIWARP